MSSHEPQAAARASPWRVLGTGVTLLAFLGALILVGLGLAARPMDGAQEQRELFGEAPPPFGLVLDSAMRLPSGDTLLHFAREEAAAPGPSEVLFLTYRSPSAVDVLFLPAEVSPMDGSMDDGPMGGELSPDPAKRLEEWEKDKAFDWHFTMKRGEIAWGEWRTKYLIERSFRKGDGWYEEARVDLRTPKRALVLFAHWPRETAVEERELRELLGAVLFPSLEGQ